MTQDSFNWEDAVRQWASRRRDVSAEFGDTAVAFFRRVFEHTAYPDRSWFGIHHNVVSLVVGNIWLASVNARMPDKGAWLLLQSKPAPINGWDFFPTKSTLQSPVPLIWGNGGELSSIAATLPRQDVWESYALASRDIFESPQIAGDRDEVQLRRGKERLSDFWGVTERAEELQRQRPLTPERAQAASSSFGAFHTEKSFETDIIVPLLNSFGWNFKREYSFPFVLGTRTYTGRVDFLVSDNSGYITLIENKLQILDDKDLEFARGQARSYASALELSAFVVAAPQGIWLYAFERGKTCLVQKLDPISVIQNPGQLKARLLELR